MNIKQFLKNRKSTKLKVTLKFLLVVYTQFVVFRKQCIFECQRLWFYSKRKPVIESYLKTNQSPKLQIGSGGNPLPGWLNTDLYPSADKPYLDASEPFPFEDELFDYVFCEHIIEHIAYRQGMGMLKECFRILKPSGRIRISTPNLQVYLDLFSSEKSVLQQRYLEWICGNWLQRQKILSQNESLVLNLVMRGWDHQFIYDYKTLKDMLEGMGFSDITQKSCGVSDDENFRGLEGHGDFIGNNEMNNFETLVLEAIKPALIRK